VLLLLTGSSDGTADRIVQHSELPVFRFNLDLFNEYRVIHNVGNWSITNQAGLTISSETATRVFWWKAFSYGLDLDSFLLEELKYFFRDLYSWFGYRNAIDSSNFFGVFRNFIQKWKNRFFVRYGNI
jgi:hypothetical protein